MQQILMFLLVIIAIAVIVLVLLQQGKGADVGASFGSGASNTVFGSQGSGSFLMKLTLGLAVIFFIICIVLARMAVQQSKASQAVDLPPTQSSQSLPVQQNNTVPAIPSKTTSADNDTVPVVPK